MTKRKRYSAEFKETVALAALREELTTAERAKKCAVHPTMIGNWKKQAIENTASGFGGSAEKEPAISLKDVEKLHAKIGQLVVERDFLSEASSRGRPASSSVLEAKGGEARLSRSERSAAMPTVILDVCAVQRATFYHRPRGESAENLRFMEIMDAGFCIKALKEASAEFGTPEIFRHGGAQPDQGSRFTSADFTAVLLDGSVKISMDGRGRWIPSRRYCVSPAGQWTTA